MRVLSDIAQRVYREGVISERTATAEHFITTSIPLREAVERGDAQQARAAAQALISAGRITNLLITRRAGAAGAPAGSTTPGARTLTEIGPEALSPISGTLTGVGGVPIGSFLTSVWSDSGFVLETDGITEGLTALRRQGHSLPGSLQLPAGPLPASGTMRVHGVGYRYSSFPASAYPSGTLRVYLLRSTDSLAPAVRRQRPGHARQRAAPRRDADLRK